MGQDLSTDEDRIRERLTVLEDLVGVLDRQLTPLGMVMDRQSRAMWTDIPSCAGFAAEYAGTVGQLQQGLLGLRSQLVGLQAALADSARSLARTDQDIQDRLTALAVRLADVPIVRFDDATPTGGGGTW